MRNLNRREMLALMGSAALVGIVGCDSGSNSGSPSPTGTAASTAAAGTSPTATSTAAATVACVVRPEQTEGPYFVDEKLERSDIRSDPSDGSVRAGVPLQLVFNVYQMSGSGCVPLAGALVDVWQCDAAGVYSDVQGSAGKKFLRGYQTTNAQGVARFTTIIPGWYQGRTVHTHFKIRTNPTSGRGLEFTSQLFFDDTLIDQIFAQAPYSSRGQRSTRNNNDGIFSQGGSQLMLPMTRSGESYTGTFDIALQV